MKKCIELWLGCALVMGAAERTAQADTLDCEAAVRRTNVVSCALAANLGAKAERLGLEGLEGRRRAASVLLPSNPTVSVSGAYPIEPGLTQRPALWSATLSQEFEIAGQRGARVDVADAEQRAQRMRIAIADRSAAADALTAYFDALAATEASAVADRMALVAAALRNVARGRAQAGVGSDADALLAEATATRLSEAQLTARQRVALARATLSSLLGGNPADAGRLSIEGDLTPLALVDVPAAALVETAVSRRAEISVALAEKDAQEKRVAMYERLRIPNPTLSLFVRNDWIGERSAGIGLGFPIPLPAPVGRTYAGDIAEANALARRAETDAERLRRAVRLDVTRALEIVAARKQQVALYRPEQVRQTEATLRSIAEELDARRLPVRDALLTQQGLTEYLYAYVEARRSLCQASVELARASGAPLERGAP